MTLAGPGVVQGAEGRQTEHTAVSMASVPLFTSRKREGRTRTRAYAHALCCQLSPWPRVHVHCLKTEE